MKTCRKCGESKPRSDYYVDKRGHIKSQCKPCWIATTRKYTMSRPGYHKNQTRTWLRKSRYGVTAAEYDAMLTRQGSACAICHIRPDDAHSLCVDHDHETGELRELLCQKCNRLLGQANDSAQRLHDAGAYLERHGVKDVLQRKRDDGLAISVSC